MSAARPTWTSITLIPLATALIAAIASAVLLLVAEESRHRFESWLRERGSYPWQRIRPGGPWASDTTEDFINLATRPRLRNAVPYLFARWTGLPVMQQFPKDRYIAPRYRVVTVDTFVRTVRARDPKLADRIDEAFLPGANAAEPEVDRIAFPDIEISKALSFDDVVRGAASFNPTAYLADRWSRVSEDDDNLDDAEETA